MTTHTSGGPIIWALKGKLPQPVFMRTRPRTLGWRQIPELPTFPWNDADRPPITYGIVDRPLNVSEKAPIRINPAVVHQLLPNPPTFFQIAGQTKDSTGAALGSCAVDLFLTSTDAVIERLTSNADGYFYFKQASQGLTYYLVAYKTGSPDLTGATVNTLTGV